MPRVCDLIPPLKKHVNISGYLPDDIISFNIDRRANPLHNRIVTILPPYGNQRPIVPGLSTDRDDIPLKMMLKNGTRWDYANTYGFRLNNILFSFAWRSRRSDLFISSNIRHPEMLKGKVDREIKRTFRNYRSHLLHHIAPGNVFLMPDLEIMFQNQYRKRKPYARRTLIFDVYSDRLLIIPFSTNLAFLNRDMDILFDSSSAGGRLDPRSQPAIENFPYLRFPMKTFLSISSVQSVDIKDFLDSALEFLCAVDRKVLDLAGSRLKNFLGI